MTGGTEGTGSTAGEAGQKFTANGDRESSIRQKPEASHLSGLLGKVLRTRKTAKTTSGGISRGNGSQV